ncbi:hypothetical protein K438DRAFT_1976443 [Mycena galopus ATCC 62051]|nr:hypothetical protein K438DRAFT_1976443 [Mycena galopus ATCC 62051]
MTAKALALMCVIHPYWPTASIKTETKYVPDVGVVSFNVASSTNQQSTTLATLRRRLYGAELIAAHDPQNHRMPPGRCQREDRAVALPRTRRFLSAAPRPQPHMTLKTAAHPHGTGTGPTRELRSRVAMHA